MIVSVFVGATLGSSTIGAAPGVAFFEVCGTNEGTELLLEAFEASFALASVLMPTALVSVPVALARDGVKNAPQTAREAKNFDFIVFYPRNKNQSASQNQGFKNLGSTQVQP